MVTVRTTTPADKPSATRIREHRGKQYQISEAHPAADLLDWLPDDEMQALADDIGQRGQEHDCERLPDERLIDGRNRELACLIAGREPRYKTVHLSEDEIPAHVWGVNGLRRHLSPQSRRKFAAMFREKGDSLRTIAKKLGVSKNTIQRDLSEGVPDGTPEPVEPKRVNGPDGKSYPASKPRPDTSAAGQAPALATVSEPTAADRLEREREQADEIIRAARELDGLVREYSGTKSGALMSRVTFGGAPLLVTRVERERRGTGTVERTVPACGASPAQLVAALRRIRPQSLCAGCRGAGCFECKLFGFVPHDEKIIRTDGQQRFDFGEGEGPSAAGVAA